MMDQIVQNVKLSDKQIREEWYSEYEQTRLELEASFTRDKYNVVRKELFAHRNDAACTIRPDSITFNQSCINGLENVVYIRISVNAELRRILVEPCEEDTPHALRWCVVGETKRKTRTMTGRDFSTILYNLMRWNNSTRYKVLGFRIKIENGVFAYLFRLDSPEMFDILPPVPKQKGKRNEDDLDSERKIEDSTPIEKEQTTKPSPQKGYYSEEMYKSYGIPYEQYQKDLSVVEKDGFLQLGMLTGGQEDNHG